MECVSYEENTCRAIQLRKEKVFADAQLWLNNGELRTHRLGMRFVLDSATCKTIQLEELIVLASLHFFGSVDLIALECASYKETTRSLLPKFWQKYGAGCGWVLKRINVHKIIGQNIMLLQLTLATWLTDHSSIGGMTNVQFSMTVGNRTLNIWPNAVTTPARD